LIEPGAIVLTLGAGDIWRAGDTLVKKGGSRTSRRAGRANAGGGSR